MPLSTEKAIVRTMSAYGRLDDGKDAKEEQSHTRFLSPRLGRYRIFALPHYRDLLVRLVALKQRTRTSVVIGRIVHTVGSSCPKACIVRGGAADVAPLKMQILTREQLHEKNVGKAAKIIEAHPVIITATAAAPAWCTASWPSHRRNFIFKRLIGTRVILFPSNHSHSFSRSS